MRSFTILRHSFVALALAACTSSPDVTFEVHRSDPSTMVALTVCPADADPMSSPCEIKQVAFAAGALSKKVDLYVDNNASSIGVILGNDGHCAAANIAIAGGVHVTYDAAMHVLSCTPASACTTYAAGAATCP